MMWVPSFILHFKRGCKMGEKKKKWYTILAGTLVFIVTVCGITGGLNYLYVDDTDEFSRYMLHDFYKQEENIDRLYIGSSHVFCGINPVILDDINGENNYNLATGTQQLITSYYLLREADRKHDIEKVYLDLYYDCTTEGLGNFHEYETIPYSWIVLNQMKPSVNKLSYILHLSEPRYYYMSFLAFTRYKEQLFQPDYIANIVERKQTDVYKNYEYEHIRKVDGKEYVMHSAQKGFMTYNGVIEAGGFYSDVPETPMKENPLTEESLEYLLKIVEYCKNRGIVLTCIGCPISDFQLQANGTYDNYVSQIRSLAKEYGFSYYDFNLCKEEYLDVADNCYWSDQGHLNTAGAEKFTEFLGKFLLAEENGEVTYQDCFYDSYAQKMKNTQERIFGLEAIKEETQEGVEYSIRPIHNVHESEKQFLSVKVWKIPENGEKEILFDTVSGEDALQVILPVDEHGTLHIEAGFAGEEVSNWVKISY
ncbi:MAG: hypothetical protein PUD93_09120 [Lachnospiraceae bacterium]|nr:hypothetical protein [Lachnospiraceae bacterium]